MITPGMIRIYPLALCLCLTACVLPSWPPPWVDDDDTRDDDTGDDDTGDDDTGDDDTGDDDTGACVDGATATGAADTTWVTICGSTYSMGDPETGSEAEPVHPVTMSTFEMLRTEVTGIQYQQCRASGDCTEPVVYDPSCNWNESGYEGHPVNCVSWQQAADFCTWVGGRLPSESEWEYAARSGGLSITYPWGDAQASCDQAVMYGDELAEGCGTGRTWEVCSKPAGDSDQGLCDLSGNVFEWVQDVYHGCYDCALCPGVDDCDSSTPAPGDGSAWEVPAGSERVMRGGSFNVGWDVLRAGHRYSNPPEDGGFYVGIRCVR